MARRYIAVPRVKGRSLLGFVSDHRVVMILQVPREALEFAKMSINFRSGKFGYSICPIFSKGHAKNRTYGALPTNAWAGVS